MKYLSIDIGTTGGKVALFSGNMELLCCWRQDYPTYITEEGLGVEQNPEDWWNLVKEGVPRVLAEAGISGEEVNGIGISCMTPVLLPVDREGKPLCRSWLWNDRRGAGYLEQICQRISRDEQIRIVGTVCKEVSFLNKLLFYRDKMPEAYDRTAAFLQASGYLAYRLTGRICMDASHGELLFLTDKMTGDYSRKIFEKFSLNIKKFPPICPVNQVAGFMTKQTAEELGLKSGIPVLSGGHDSALSAYALGAKEAGDACLDLGNAANLIMCTETPVFCPAGDVYRHPDGKWLFQIYSATIGAAFRWLKDNFGIKEQALETETGISAYDQLCETAKRSIPGANGLLFLPYLLGAQQDSEVSGAFLNIRLMHKWPDFIRALLEGCAYSVRYNMEQMEKAAGMRMEEITVCGGGSKNLFWLQIFADVLNKPLRISRIREAAVTGAAMLVRTVRPADTKEAGRKDKRMTQKELVHPDSGQAVIYELSYQRFREAFEQQMRAKG